MPVKHDRGLSYDRTATVSVIWGFKEGYRATYSFDTAFDMSRPQAQRAMVKFCDRVEAEKTLKVFQTSCWPKLFQEWLHAKGRTPSARHFAADLNEFLHTGAAGWVGDHIGFRSLDNYEPFWLVMDFRTQFDTHSSGMQTEPFLELWESFIKKESERLPVSLGIPVPSTSLFQRAEAENKIVKSALSSWLVSVACALLAVAAFTRDCGLTAAATFAIFATAACCVFVMTSVWKWRFGLMEAVSLIIFCGFSVDYPLHVVQAYVMERGRGKGVLPALQEVGCAVLSGCATTCGGAFPLWWFCKIVIFNRFGQVLIVNMLFAVIFALIWIPAVLEMRCSCPNRKVGDDVAHSYGSTADDCRELADMADADDGFTMMTTPRG